MGDRQIPWIGPSELSRALLRQRPAFARVVAAQIACPHTLSRELERHQLTLVTGDTDSALEAQAVDIMVGCSERALANVDDEDPGFGDSHMRQLVRKLATDSEFALVVSVIAVCGEEFAAQVRTNLRTTAHRMRDVGDVMVAIASAAEHVARRN